MTRLTITIEDAADGVLIVGDPSMKELAEKVRSLPKGQLVTIAESIALAAWTAILTRCQEIGATQTGELH